MRFIVSTHARGFVAALVAFAISLSAQAQDFERFGKPDYKKVESKGDDEESSDESPGKPSTSAPLPQHGFQRLGETLRETVESLWAPKHRRRDTFGVKGAFREIVTDAREATVAVKVGGKQVALGGIVGPDGWVLTKASQVRGATTVRMVDGREFDARLVGVDREHDLAMLKVDAKELPTLTLDGDIAIEPGAWVVTPGRPREPVAIGVASVGPRPIPHRPGILGVRLAMEDVANRPGALVVGVFEDTGAERAGVLVNDLITKVNDQAVRSRVELVQSVRRYSPGDEVELTLSRGDQTIVVKAMLTGRAKVMNRMFGESRSRYQNSLGSKLSERRYGFPRALQHDTVLRPSDCGGPLVDLDGNVVGFNISRAGRTESYAIPTADVLKLMYELMSGKQPPEEG